MMNTPERNLTIDDFKKMFGNRIKRVIIQSEPNKNNHSYEGLSHKKMVKLCKKWKFWNVDIKKAYKNYAGIIFMPYTIEMSTPVVIGSDYVVSKMIKNRYSLAVLDHDDDEKKYSGLNSSQRKEVVENYIKRAKQYISK